MHLKDEISAELVLQIPFPTLYDFAYFLVDVNSAIAIANRLIEGKTFYKKRNIYTNRNIIIGYKNYVGVKKYQGGSLIVSIVATVIGGIILHYIIKVLDKNRTPPTHIDKQTIIQINVNTETIQTFNDMLPPNLSQIPQEDIHRIMRELQKKGLIPSDIIIDEKGIDYLIQTIDRLVKEIKK